MDINERMQELAGIETINEAPKIEISDELLYKVLKDVEKYSAFSYEGYDKKIANKVIKMGLVGVVRDWPAINNKGKKKIQELEKKGIKENIEDIEQLLLEFLAKSGMETEDVVQKEQEFHSLAAKFVSKIGSLLGKLKPSGKGDIGNLGKLDTILYHLSEIKRLMGDSPQSFANVGLDALKSGKHYNF